MQTKIIILDIIVLEHFFYFVGNKILVMIDSKLIELYQKLNNKELRELRKWVLSPIHNDHKDVKTLFNFIDSRNSLTATTLQKKRAWSYIYPKQDYDDARLRYIMSLGLKVLINFVGYKRSVDDTYTTNKVLAEYFCDQKMLKQSEQHLKLAQKSISKNTHNSDYHQKKYQLETAKLEIVGTDNWGRSTNLVTITQHARLFFMITTLRHAYIALSHQNIKKEDYIIPMLDSILTEIESGGYEEEIILMIYYHGYQTFNNPQDTKHFTELKALLINQEITLDSTEKVTVLRMVINYSIKQLHAGKLEYIKEAFELYRYGLEHQCLMENNKLSLFAYANIVSLGLNLKEFDWIAEFIPAYSKYLDVEHPQNYEHHNTAKLEFMRGDLDKAMSLLIQTEYDDLFLNMTAKVILIKIYYLQDSFDALEALLESFRVFLNRKKVLSYHKQNFMNFIKLTKKLLYLKPNKGATKKLVEQVKNTNPLTEKRWLLEQLEQIQ